MPKAHRVPFLATPPEMFTMLLAQAVDVFTGKRKSDSSEQDMFSCSPLQVHA